MVCYSANEPERGPNGPFSRLSPASGLSIERWLFWTHREGGGGGRTRIIQNGNILEKGGVNFSAVHGKLPEAIKKAFGVDEEDFFATGVSIVIHPNNPHVPIIHMNIRYFELNVSVLFITLQLTFVHKI